jgi:hypothetical protein
LHQPKVKKPLLRRNAAFAPNLSPNTAFAPK